MARRFPIRYFFCVAQSDSWYMLTSGFSSSPYNSFFVLLNHSAFLLYSFNSHILLQNCFAFFTSVC